MSSVVGLEETSDDSGVPHLSAPSACRRRPLVAESSLMATSTATWGVTWGGHVHSSDDQVSLSLRSPVPTLVSSRRFHRGGGGGGGRSGGCLWTPGVSQAPPLLPPPYHGPRATSAVPASYLSLTHRPYDATEGVPLLSGTASEGLSPCNGSGPTAVEGREGWQVVCLAQ